MLYIFKDFPEAFTRWKLAFLQNLPLGCKLWKREKLSFIYSCVNIFLLYIFYVTSKSYIFVSIPWKTWFFTTCWCSNIITSFSFFRFTKKHLGLWIVMYHLFKLLSQSIKKFKIWSIINLSTWGFLSASCIFCSQIATCSFRIFLSYFNTKIGFLIGTLLYPQEIIIVPSLWCLYTRFKFCDQIAFVRKI